MARILVADDDESMQVAISLALGKAGFEVTVVRDGAVALEQIEAQSWDLVITDDKMPEVSGLEVVSTIVRRGLPTPVIMITAHGTVNRAVEAMQHGAADFIMKPFDADELLRVVNRTLCLSDDIAASRPKRGSRHRPLITNDPTMIRVLEVAEAVARSDATVLVQGESGTGKELIARLIHFSSPRRHQSFVAVNCAALPHTLLESELFGHEKGAFTGAQARKIGKFELAHGGTILLDEISEMELGLQAKLLRVLQEREVDRVGGGSPVSIDVRVVATTNRDLQRMVDAGQFRADLFYRLNVIPLIVPPLRARRGDIRLLVEHFMRQFLGDDRPSVTEEILLALEQYPWPGNIRELQNAVQRAAILCTGGTPKEADFLLSAPADGGGYLNWNGSESVTLAESQPQMPLDKGIDSHVSELEGGLLIRSGMTVEQVERALILETLKATRNNRTHAAKLLGISIRTLRNKLNEYRASGVQMDGGDSVFDD